MFRRPAKYPWEFKLFKVQEHEYESCRKNAINSFNPFARYLETG
jgi:hypothetical protein